MKVTFGRNRNPAAQPQTESSKPEAPAPVATESAAPAPARRNRPAPREIPPVEPAPETQPTVDVESTVVESAMEGKLDNYVEPAPTPEPAPTQRRTRTAEAPKRTRRVTRPEPDEPTEDEPAARRQPQPKAPVQERSLARPSKPFEVGGFRDDPDDVDPTDLVLPRLNIVQKVGELSEHYEAGVLLLGRKVEMPNPCNVLVIAFRPSQYVERVKGGGIGSTLNSLEEVAAHGGTTDYNEAEDRDIPLFQKMVTALTLIEAPNDATEDELAYFPFEYEGCRYALALWSMKGTAYTHAAKHLKTARRAGIFKGRFTRALKAGLVNQFITLATEVKKYGRNFAAIPVIDLGEETTPEFRSWVAEILQGSQAAAAATDGVDPDDTAF